MKNLFVYTLGIALSVMVQCVNAQITIHSGVKGGSYFQIANDIKDIYSPGTLEVVPSAGSLRNLKELASGQIGIIQYDVLQTEYYNDVLNGSHTTADIRLLLPLGAETIHLVTKNPDIKSLNALEGKKVAIGNANQGTNLTALTIKKMVGIEWVDMEISIQSAVQQLLRDEIDAFFFVSFAPVQQLQNLSNLPADVQSSLHLVPITTPELDKYYTKITVKAGTYGWLKEDVQTYAVRSVLATNVKNETKLQQEQLEGVLEKIKTNKENLKKVGHVCWRSVDYSFESVKWEPYKGAIKVFNLKRD